MDSGFAFFGFDVAFFGWQPGIRAGKTSGKFLCNFGRPPVFNWER